MWVDEDHTFWGYPLPKWGGFPTFFTKGRLQAKNLLQVQAKKTQPYKWLSSKLSKSLIYGSSTSLKSHEQLNLIVYMRKNIKGWVSQMMGNFASLVGASDIYHRDSKLTTSSIVTVGVALVLKCKTYLYSSNCWNEVRIGWSNSVNNWLQGQCGSAGRGLFTKAESCRNRQQYNLKIRKK